MNFLILQECQNLCLKKHDIVNIVNENILLISQLDSSVNFKLNTFQQI